MESIMGTYDRLTRYLPLLEKGPWEKTVQESTGADGVLHLPHVEYTDIVCSFVQELYQVWEEQRELADYQEVLQKNGLNDIWQGARMAEQLDGPCVLALMMWTLRAERFSPGTLLSALEAGHIQACLSRLTACQNKDRRAIKMTKLFKERCCEKNHETMLSLMDELDEALEQRKRGNDKPLKRLLYGIDDPTQYEGHPNHTVCEGFEGESKESREARICKCLFFKNAADPTLVRHCQGCAFYGKFDLELRGEYQVAEYQIPAYYSIGGIGAIDLILQKKSDPANLYAVEIKPPEHNQESLLRMIAEILTYTLGFPDRKYNKAIAFFQGSYQYRRYFEQRKAYQDVRKRIDRILKDEEISVFCFEKVEGEKAYKICKL